MKSTISFLFIVIIFTNNLFAQLPFSDSFESGNFTTGGWVVTGGAQISTQNPYHGNYCVQGPATYMIKKEFSSGITANEIVIEYAMRANQTGSNSVVFTAKAANDSASAIVFFRWIGYIVAYNGIGYNNAISLLPYNSNTWYLIRIVIKQNIKKYDVYINGTKYADNFNYYNLSAGPMKSFEWASGETWGVGWIDKVSINDSYTNLQENNYQLADFELYQNYPNPFNPTTIIKYSIPFATFVTLKIYDATGQEIKTVVNEYKNAGTYEEKFNAVNLSNGIYLYELRANNFRMVKKLVIVK